MEETQRTNESKIVAENLNWIDKHKVVIHK